MVPVSLWGPHGPQDNAAAAAGPSAGRAAPGGGVWTSSWSPWSAGVTVDARTAASAGLPHSAKPANPAAAAGIPPRQDGDAWTAAPGPTYARSLDAAANAWQLAASSTSSSSTAPAASSISAPLDSTVPVWRGRVLAMSQDQHGCRYLQDLLDDASAWRDVFAELRGALHGLAVHPFANYLVQKVLDAGGQEAALPLLEEMEHGLAAAACCRHGTRVVQKLVAVAGGGVAAGTIAAALGDGHGLTACKTAGTGGWVRLATDLHGNHVVQAAAAVLPPQLRAGIYAQIAAGVGMVAAARHGCCVVQRLLENGGGEELRLLRLGLLLHAQPLVLDPFGNYAIQTMLERGESWVHEQLAMRLAGCLAHMSRQKHSSNVIERLLRGGDSNVRRALVDELFRGEGSYASPAALLLDPFANFVLQTALAVADEAEYNLFFERLTPPPEALTPPPRKFNNPSLRQFLQTGVAPAFDSVLQQTALRRGAPSSVPSQHAGNGAPRDRRRRKNQGHGNGQRHGASSGGNSARKNDAAR